MSLAAHDKHLFILRRESYDEPRHFFTNRDTLRTLRNGTYPAAQNLTVHDRGRARWELPENQATGASEGPERIRSRLIQNSDLGALLLVFGVVVVDVFVGVV